MELSPASRAVLDTPDLMPALPNLLRTRPGRLLGFFLLYMGEGLPQGFTGTAVALEFKRMGMTGAAIGSFLAFIMLPWTWKWVMGPLVDNLSLKRFGRRKQWIVSAQVGMILTLVGAILLFPHAATDASGATVFTGFALFSGVLLAHNIFAASQDVAIDALACTALTEDERGVANGLMFAGAQVGSAIGGSGVLFLKGVLGFPMASLIAPLVLIGILLLVILLIFEHHIPHIFSDGSLEPETVPQASFGRAQHEIALYLGIVLRVFFMTRRGFLGMVLAVIPFGGMALSLTVSNVLTPTLGMTDKEIATLMLAGSLAFTVFCMAGGFLSDRYGRKLTLAVFSAGTLLPTLWMGWKLHSAGWTMPAEASPDGTWPRHEALIQAWWIASMVYSLFQGLMYGIRTAFFMDIVEPRIAATHFTALMALLNFSTACSYWWEGKAITPLAKDGWGFTYFQIFLLDAAIGAVFLLILPFMKIHARDTEAGSG